MRNYAKATSEIVVNGISKFLFFFACFVGWSLENKYSCKTSTKHNFDPFFSLHLLAKYWTICRLKLYCSKFILLYLTLAGRVVILSAPDKTVDWVSPGQDRYLQSNYSLLHDHALLKCTESASQVKLVCAALHPALFAYMIRQTKERKRGQNILRGCCTPRLRRVKQLSGKAVTVTFFWRRSEKWTCSCFESCS